MADSLDYETSVCVCMESETYFDIRNQKVFMIKTLSDSEYRNKLIVLKNEFLSTVSLR